MLAPYRIGRSWKMEGDRRNGRDKSSGAWMKGSFGKIHNFSKLKSAEFRSRYIMEYGYVVFR